MSQTRYQGTFRGIQQELEPKNLLAGLLTGMIVGITETIFAVSLVSLIFSGELASNLPYGIGITLVTAAVMMIVTALISSVPAVIGSTQDTSSVILGVIAAGLVSMLSTAGAHEKLATVLAAIAITTLLTGIFFLVLGMFRLGGLVRFVPYPVIGGFLAATGWLLMKGSFGVMDLSPVTFRSIGELLQPDQLILWIPSVLCALILFLGMRRIHHFMAMPAILLGTIAIFYLALLVTGTSIQEAIHRGLLMGGLSGGATLQPFFMQDLLAVDWKTILGQSGNIAIILVLCVVSLLLNASALELAIGRNIDLNQELKAAGVANILSGLSGGMVGYHALSLSTLSYRMGARGRLPGLVAGVTCAVILFAGSSLLTYFPKSILAGLILFLGLDFLFEWVVVGWSKLSHSDYAVVLLILVVIAATNFLVGVAIGLIAAIILFVLNYSRINVVHHSMSGSEIRSNVERCAYHQRVLAEQLGQQIYVIELQGFIFFGTANALFEQVRERIIDPQQAHLRYIILDFRRVTGLDSSAVLSFVKGKQLADAQNITLILTNISKETSQQFEQGDLLQAGKDIHIFPDLDHGLEWCEEQLLEIEGVTTLHTPVTLIAQLADRGFEKSNTKRLLSYLECTNFETGEYLLHQGEEADRLYFIEMGTVSTYLELENQKRMRLQTLGLGTAIGESGLYLGAKCNASAIADSPVTAYRLTRASLQEMKEKEPDLAATFHEFAAHLLSEKLTATTRTLEAVLR